MAKRPLALCGQMISRESNLVLGGIYEVGTGTGLLPVMYNVQGCLNSDHEWDMSSFMFLVVSRIGQLNGG